ncbi:PH domain-containing protein [Oleisolibacter albus]|uniref:PH domain-containing protein n=1 Tax=Oleisolibacter albus TaxID=2171757 RepID=UPI000DF4477D|nr:PH domain-containing protein [Oleisolibacter albus]
MAPVPSTGPDPDLLETAVFDPKLRLYLFLKAGLLLAVTGIGLVLLPLSLWAAWWWSGHFFTTIRCRLTRRRLYFSYGILFQRERTIPLDKIQDLSLIRGPLLNALGLCTLRIETAGASATPGSSAADLVGLVGAKAFQERVLAQRDQQMHSEARPEAPGPVSAPVGDATAPLLAEIRDLLRNIDGKIV